MTNDLTLRKDIEAELESNPASPRGRADERRPYRRLDAPGSGSGECLNPIGRLTMTVDRMVLAFAGCVVLLGITLAYFVNIWWIGLAIFAGLNMIQAAFTGFCPAATIFKKFGIKPGVAFR